MSQAPDTHARSDAGPSGEPSLDDHSQAAVVLLTKTQARGASQRVAGMTIGERAVRQLLQAGRPQVLVIDDGTVPLPATWPPGVLVQTVGDAGSELDELRAQWREEEGRAPDEFAGDTVRPRDGDLSFAMRVTDEASRDRAERAVFRELGRSEAGLADRLVGKRLSIPLTRQVLSHLPFGPVQITIGRAALAAAGLISISLGSYASIVFGFLILVAQSVLNLSADEMARLRFAQNAAHHRLSALVGDGVDLGLFLAVALGVTSAAHSTRLVMVALFATTAVVFHHVVAYRERFLTGAELFAPVRWWHTDPDAEKDARDRIAVGQIGPWDVVRAAARSDFMILAWTVLAVVGFFRLIVLYALIVSLVRAGSAGGQLARGPTQRASVDRSSPDHHEPS